MTSRTPYLVAAIAGAAVWLATSLLTGRREAWDAGAYWLYAYPLAVLMAGVIGYLAPASSAWGIGLSLTLAQAVVLAFASRSFTLLPLGLVLFGILALPLVAVAAVARSIGRR
jgi:hypothetical protein